MARKAVWIPILVLLGGSVARVAQDEAKAKPEHLILTADDLQWADAPPSLPTGAKLAKLEGDPAKEGFFTMRLKLPAGYKIPPHWHPGYERVTVVSGIFNLGLGESFDESKTKVLPAGSYVSLPSKTAHFAMTTKETVLQLTTIGPWGLTYVNPADDPRQKK
jgi:quercetin dioxygenase-like cupin family protein